MSKFKVGDITKDRSTIITNKIVDCDEKEYKVLDLRLNAHFTYSVFYYEKHFELDKAYIWNKEIASILLE